MPWLHRRRALLVRAAALLVVLALFAPMPSAATEHEEEMPTIGSFIPCDRPVTPPRCVSVGNDTRHHIYIDPSVPPGLADSIRQAMRDAYEPTNLVIIEQAAVNFLTDAIAYASDHGRNGAAGWTYCPPDSPQGVNKHGDRWCKPQEIHFNLNAAYAVFFADDASRDHLACHEMGHTLGLRHWGNPPQTDLPLVGATCMNSDTPNGPTNLHDIDRDLINGYYPVPAPISPARRCNHGSEV